MKFIPIELEKWLEQIKRDGIYKGLTDSEMKRIYRLLVKEANQGMIAATALGGKWKQELPDLPTRKNEDDKKDNILDAPAELMVSVFRTLYAEYERKVRRMFIDPATVEISITPKQVVESLHSVGLEEYASQVYMLFNGLYLGCVDRIEKVILEVNGLVAAYQIADDLGVDINDIDPKAALESLKKKENHEDR